MRAAFAIALAACSGDVPETDPLPVLVDINPEPGVVEVELVAEVARVEYLPGKPAEVWAYRDGARPGAKATVPGPMLEARVGDRVIVHFRNALPVATTIHWHGLRVANEADGTTLSQVPIAPGESFDYELELVDSGLYWYHPHVDGDVQVERGLYAPIRIAGELPIDVGADRVFVLDDVKLEASGALSPLTDALDLMLGRQGNVVLVNGRRGMTIEAAAGSRERWRFVNAANGRYFQLVLPGHAFLVIGWDGGLVRAPYITERLLVAPGERYEVLVDIAAEAGERLVVSTVHYDRGHSIPDPGPIELVTIDVVAGGADALDLPAFPAIDKLVVDDATPRRRFVLREDDRDPLAPLFTINDQAFPNVTPVDAALGAVEIWEIENATEMDHPFHLHGMSFQLVGDDPPLGWKDTLNIPRETTVPVAVQYTAAGQWMFHCHILEHAERGMMGHLHVR